MKSKVKFSDKTDHEDVGTIDCANESLNEVYTDCNVSSNYLHTIICKASFYSQLGDFNEADEFFKIAEDIDDGDVLYLFEMGKHLLNQDKFLESIIYFDMCLEIDDEMAIAWMYKSMALSEIGQDAESEKCFNTAVDLDPHSMDVFDEVIVIDY